MPPEMGRRDSPVARRGPHPPPLEGTRLDLVKSLKVGGDALVASGAVTRGGRRGVALEIALSVMLFVGAAMLWRSYRNISATDLGYPAERLIQPWVTLDRSRYADDSWRRPGRARRMQRDVRQCGAIKRVVPADRSKKDLRIAHRSRERADLVKRGAHRDEPEA